MSQLWTHTVSSCRKTVGSLRSSVRWQDAVTVAVLVIAAACTDAVKNPVAPPASVASPTSTVGGTSNGTGACMGDDSFASGLVPGLQSATGLNCTSNDIDIAIATISEYSFDNVTFTPFDPNTPINCAEGQTIYVNTSAELVQNAASTRADVGIWIATDGGAAITGTCTQYTLVNGTTGVSNNDGDLCGDMNSGSTTIVPLDILTLTCHDNGSGLLHVGACLGWTEPGADRTCPVPGVTPTTLGYRYGSVPGNKSKCNCNGFDLPVNITRSAQLEVAKVCDPTSDTGTFDLLIDGSNSFADNVACGGTTGSQTVTAGSTASPGAVHTFGEGDFTTTNYTSSYSCVNRVGGASRGSGTSLGPNNITLQPDDDVICTYTNVRIPTLTVNKVCAPTTDGGHFNLQIDGSNAGTGADAACGGTTGAVVETVGSHTVGETAGTSTVLTDYTTVISGACASDGTVTLAAGQNAVCTITNSRQPTLTVNKVCAPTSDPGHFNLQIDAANAGTGADAACGGTTGAVVETVGLHTVGETAGTATDLTNYVSVISGACALDGTVTLAAGQNAVCTITNSRKAVLVVDKVTVGGGTQLFDFSETSIANFQLADATTPKVTTNLLPGNYTVCELALAVAWNSSATVNGSPATIDLDGTTGDGCLTVALAYGDSTTIVITNTPPPGGTTRTIGYWKNWSSCAQSKGKQYAKAIANGDPEATLDFYLGGAGVTSIYPIGNITTLTCAQAVALLSKNAIDGSSRSGDPIYNLVAQLLAAKLNVAAGAGTCATLDQALIDAQTLLAAIGFDGTKYYSGKLKNYTLTSAQLAEALRLEAIFASYNEGTLAGCPTHV
jgi:hypothetical protein